MKLSNNSKENICNSSIFKNFNFQCSYKLNIFQNIVFEYSLSRMLSANCQPRPGSFKYYI